VAYFRDLGKKLETPVVVAVTGGIAASILADERTTDDIDFAILKGIKQHQEITKLLDALAEEHGIAVQYSEDIGRWSMIDMLDWRRHSKPYHRFGMLEVRVLEPLYWSIGKVSRGMQRDFDDIVKVFKKKKIPWEKAVRLWSKALRKSPVSESRGQALRQMEDFFTHEGKKVWARTFEPKAALAELRRLTLQARNKAGEK
jgi:hypothetical protein